MTDIGLSARPAARRRVLPLATTTLSESNEGDTTRDPAAQLDFSSVNDKVLDELFRANNSELKEQLARRTTSKEFLSFLRNENGVFFICGKAGSGKSTIMKFIGDNNRVREELEIWAGKTKLVLVRVFFWNSGDKLQMSKEGFYRSILFKVLRECPDLCQHTFVDPWGHGQAWRLLKALSPLKTSPGPSVGSILYPNFQTSLFASSSMASTSLRARASSTNGWRSPSAPGLRLQTRSSAQPVQSQTS